MQINVAFKSYTTVLVSNGTLFNLKNKVFYEKFLILNIPCKAFKKL